MGWERLGGNGARIVSSSWLQLQTVYTTRSKSSPLLLELELELELLPRQLRYSKLCTASPRHFEYLSLKSFSMVIGKSSRFTNNRLDCVDPR